jgi:photosystem II stability/assembly factor-like uncharacterized protein
LFFVPDVGKEIDPMNRTWSLLVLFGLFFVVVVSLALIPGEGMAQKNDTILPTTNRMLISDGVKNVGSKEYVMEDPKIEPKVTSAFTVTLGAWRNLRPTESYLRGVSLLSKKYEYVNCKDNNQKSKGWIVGDAGVILTFCNGVWDHAITTESIPTNLWGVQAISPTLGVIVGDQGTILMYLYDDVTKGWAWSKSPIPVSLKRLQSISVVELQPGDPDYCPGCYLGWAVGEADQDGSGGRGTIIKGLLTPIMIDGNPSVTYQWVNVTNDYQDLPVVDSYARIQALSATNAWAAGGKDGDKGIVIHWDGSQWTLFQELGTRSLTDLFMISPSDGWAVSVGGDIYHFNGTTWSAVNSPTTKILFGVGFDQNGVGWAVGEKGTLLKYLDGNWTEFTDLRTDPFEFWAVDFASGHGWMVGFHHSSKQIGGQILEYQDGTWLSVTPPTDNQLNNISNVSENDAWAVGAADDLGGTIIHWDGKHWQRWYQKELPLPKADLFAIDMVSAKDGWAAGDPLTPGAPAVFLHWDGRRWAEPRYMAPVNVRVNALDMLDSNFGWAVADDGNAVAYYDSSAGYWRANHTCGGPYYSLEDVSVVTSTVWTPIFNWDAYSVGSRTFPASDNAFLLRYLPNCTDNFAWDEYQHSGFPSYPTACLNDDGSMVNPDDGPSKTDFFGIKMMSAGWGYIVGQYTNRAVIQFLGNYGNSWTRDFCQRKEEWPGYTHNPSKLYSVDVIPSSGVAWFGGYYTRPESSNWTWAYIRYHDASGNHRVWDGSVFPINGRNIYHRPIKKIKMVSDTMGWAVGDPEDTRKISVIYQYPYPNFTLDVQPAARAITPYGSTSYTVTVNSIGGLDTDVSLKFLSMPLHLSATITPTTINSKVSARIDVQDLAPLMGPYDLALDGTAIFRSGDNDIPVERVAPIRISVMHHVVNGIIPQQGPSGTLVEIDGTNFGDDPGVGNRSTPMNHVVLAGIQVPEDNVVSWATDKIIVRVPDSVILFPHGPDVGDVFVVSNGFESNRDYSFQLESEITGTNIIKASSLITVTLYGTSFGNDPGSLMRSTYYEHIAYKGEWISNQNVLKWTNNEIRFRVFSDTLSGSVTVTSNGFESNSVYLVVSTKRLFAPMVLQKY